MIALASDTIMYSAQGPARLAVKICGLMRPEQALAAAEEGADMLGVVFASSKRRVTVEEARAIAEALDSRAARPILIGVFVNETVEEMERVAREVALDAIQMSGDESPEVVAEVARRYPVLKAFRFAPGVPLLAALRQMAPYAALGLGRRLRFLVDAYHPLEYGGTGRVADWSLSACLAAHQEIILAGGLTPGNVRQAAEVVRPYGVDVSSGVEREGVKDSGLIKSFIQAARTRE